MDANLLELVEYTDAQQKALCDRESPQPIAELSNYRYATFEQAGKFIDRQKYPPPRAHTIRTIADFADAVALWKREDSTIFVDDRGLTLVIEDYYRAERVTMPVDRTLAFAKVAEFATAPQGFSQSQLVELLKTTLRGTLVGEDKILPVLRRLRFASNVDGMATLGASRSTLGNSVERKVVGLDEETEIPEDVAFWVNVFLPPAPKIETKISAYLYTDLENRTFRLQTNKDELAQAKTDALVELKDHLLAALADRFPAERVLLGTP